MGNVWEPYMIKHCLITKSVDVELNGIKHVTVCLLSEMFNTIQCNIINV